MKRQDMPNNDLIPSKKQKTSDPALGVVLIAIATGGTLLLDSVKVMGLGNNFDPGPKAFPLGLCAILACGGLIEIWQGLRSTKSETKEPSALRHPDEAPRSKTVLILLACFLVYVALLPWLGFSVATMIMGTGMMMVLGNSWKRAALVSIALIALIYLLFVLFFHVPLPGGVFNLKF
ncbi:MAG: tripartite tricarboxylate transporter TctB family protein [Opitutaceae bacterium]